MCKPNLYLCTNILFTLKRSTTPFVVCVILEQTERFIMMLTGFSTLSA